MERTGHRSLDGVRTYKHTSNELTGCHLRCPPFRLRPCLGHLLYHHRLLKHQSHSLHKPLLMLPFPATFISTPAPLSPLTSTATLTIVFVCMLFTHKMYCNNGIPCLHYKQFLCTKQHKNCYCNFDSLRDGSLLQ